MFDPLDEDKKKKENMTLEDSLLAKYIIIFFYENDTNDVKGFVS